MSTRKGLRAFTQSALARVLALVAVLVLVGSAGIAVANASTVQTAAPYTTVTVSEHVDFPVGYYRRMVNAACPKAYPILLSWDWDHTPHAERTVAQYLSTGGVHVEFWRPATEQTRDTNVAPAFGFDVTLVCRDGA